MASNFTRLLLALTPGQLQVIYWCCATNWSPMVGHLRNIQTWAPKLRVSRPHGHLGNEVPFVRAPTVRVQADGSRLWDWRWSCGGLLYRYIHLPLLGQLLKIDVDGK